MPYTRVRGCAGSRRNIVRVGRPAWHAQNIEDSRWQIDMRRRRLRNGDRARALRGLDQHHGFRRRGNRRQSHGGRSGNERQAFAPAAEPERLQISAMIGRDDDEAAVVDAERPCAIEQRRRRASARSVIAPCMLCRDISVMPMNRHWRSTTTGRWGTPT